MPVIRRVGAALVAADRADDERVELAVERVQDWDRRLPIHKALPATAFGQVAPHGQVAGQDLSSGHDQGLQMRARGPFSVGKSSVTH